MKKYLLSIACVFFSLSLWTQDKQDSTKKAESKTLADMVKNMNTDDGLFTVYQEKEKVYFEINDSLLGRDILLVSRIAAVPSDYSPYINAGSKSAEQMIYWVKKNDKLLLRVKSYQNIAEENDPIHLSVQMNNFEPIIEAFEIKAFNKDSSAYLIDVTALFTSDVKALSGLNSALRKRYSVRSLDKGRSMIESVRSFPINVEVRHIMTYDAGEPPASSKTETMSMLMNQSFYLLPKKPMSPRLYDERVGWFTVSQIDYSSDALKSDEKRYLRRWRLEPKDKVAYARGELVEPIKPIVYYLDPATPLKWRKYFRQGVEDWNECFASAGFKNAIIAKDPPSKEEDPDFSPEDARYSVVRYVASTTRNATGPSVSDPRSGEIIESDIIWYHNHLRSYRNRYLLETGAANTLAQSLDTPEEEIGEMMRRVISHEIGHALGLPHNMKASSAYPVDSLRSSSFTQKFGIATTIMDYARYNYVAQPGDQNIRFVRQLGPYDHYAIHWGYQYLNNLPNPEEELAILKSWISEKEGDPIYMFGSGNPPIDPTSQTECIGDDNMKASEYGIKNLKIVAQNLNSWITNPNENYDDLDELYDELLGVWRRYVNHVVTNIGGVVKVSKTSDQKGFVYEPVSSTDQLIAVQFINSHVINSPYWLAPENVMMNIGSSNGLERISNYQKSILNAVLDDNRLIRIGNSNAGIQLFSQILSNIDREIWKDKSPDFLKRKIQRDYLEILSKKVSPENGELLSTDFPAIILAQLAQIERQIKGLAKKGISDLDSNHYKDLLKRIDRILDKED